MTVAAVARGRPGRLAGDTNPPYGSRMKSYNIYYRFTRERARDEGAKSARIITSCFERALAALHVHASLVFSTRASNIFTHRTGRKTARDPTVHHQVLSGRSKSTF